MDFAHCVTTGRESATPHPALKDLYKFILSIQILHVYCKVNRKLCLFRFPTYLNTKGAEPPGAFTTIIKQLPSQSFYVETRKKPQAKSCQMHLQHPEIRQRIELGEESRQGQSTSNIPPLVRYYHLMRRNVQRVGYCLRHLISPSHPTFLFE